MKCIDPLVTGYERGTFEERSARTESLPRQSGKNSEDDSRANNNIRETLGILSRPSPMPAIWRMSIPGGGILLVLQYSDDFLISSTDVIFKNKFQKALSNRFEIEWKPHADWFLQAQTPMETFLWISIAMPSPLSGDIYQLPRPRLPQPISANLPVRCRLTWFGPKPIRLKLCPTSCLLRPSTDFDLLKPSAP